MNKKQKRSAHHRCPRCKKVRKMYVRANEWHSQRVSSMNIAGEGKVCWICRIREIQPDWRPGLPLLEIQNQTKFNPNKVE